MKTRKFTTHKSTPKAKQETITRRIARAVKYGVEIRATYSSVAR